MVVLLMMYHLPSAIPGIYRHSSQLHLFAPKVKHSFVWLQNKASHIINGSQLDPFAPKIKTTEYGNMVLS